MFRKYFSNPLRFFIVYLFLPLVFFLISGALDVIYAALLEAFPKVIPEYSQVLEKEKYEAFEAAMYLSAAFISVFLISYLTGVYDNARYEDVITKTDGLFKVKDEIGGYIKHNLPSDFLAVALPPILFISLTAPSYSKKVLDYLGGFLAPHLRLTEIFGTLGAYFVIFAVAFLGRLVAAPFALRRYRTLWLTSFVEG